MRLFYKYNRINLLVTCIIFLLAAIAFYFLLNYVLISQVDEDLRIEQHEIETYVSRHSRLPEIVPVEDQSITYRLTNIRTGAMQFKTLRLYDTVEKDESSFRQLIFSTAAGGKWYQVTVAKSLEGTDAMAHTVIVITISTILLILLINLLVNRWVLRRLWKPFYATITSIRHFNLGQNKKFDPVNTNIEEFNLLNKTLQQSINKAETDYRLLKEFTENASHELQTPLAIIRSKLELLIQDEHLSEEQSYSVQCANGAIQKLSRLNQSLLLLNKIENRQFAETAPIPFKTLIKEKLEVFKELLQDKGLVVTTGLQDAGITMNRELADILLNNLLSNAIRHSNPGDELAIVLESKQLIVANTAVGGPLESEKLFYRFYKNGSSSSGNGLGLSIVKQITEVSGFDITYSFENAWHRFTLNF